MTQQKRGRGVAGYLISAAVVVAVAGALELNVVPGISELVSGTPAMAHEAPGEAAKPAPVSDPAVAKADQLHRKESELQSREANVKAQEARAAELLVNLTIQQTDADSVRRVADIYGAMPPYKAGPMIQGMEPDKAVEILRLLDQDQAAAILASLDPARAVQLIGQLMKAPVAQSHP